jgi:CRP/FNR family transcriptional regulator
VPVGSNCIACVVRGTDCFCSLPEEALPELSALGTHLHFAARERILHEGFAADRIFVLCHGRIKLTASSSEGRMLLVRIAGPGDVLGLADALNNASHKLSAETLEPCELKAVSRADFLAFLDRVQPASHNATHAIAQQYNSAILSARRLALSGNAAGKLASVLIDWSRSLKPTTPDPTAIEFSMPLTHEELGSMAGLSRETVTRLLSKFRAEKLAEQVGERIILYQPAKLEALYS